MGAELARDLELRGLFPASIRAGAVLHLPCELVNVSDRTVETCLTESRGLAVTDSAGRTVSHWDWLEQPTCTARVTLRPGESLSLSEQLAVPAELAPGAGRIRVRLAVLDLDRCDAAGLCPSVELRQASGRVRLLAAEAAVPPPTTSASTEEASPMSHLARGTFTVTLQPAGEADAADGVTRGRIALEKTFTGDLAGSGRGEMLTALTAVEGSAGYVAMERIIGTLHGRRGSFVLQHSGTMQRGTQQLTITVVPDSGTAELAGLAGTFHLEIVDGEHRYALEYTLPE